MGEGGGVRYFWVYLTSLPIVQAAIVEASGDSSQCIDLQSYIVFFFKEGRFFRTSARLAKGAECHQYSSVRDGLMGSGTTMRINEGGATVEVAFREGSQYWVLDAVQAGVASEPRDIFGFGSDQGVRCRVSAWWVGKTGLLQSSPLSGGGRGAGR
jgi:hypothetical protein